jgi:hypothetical protein
MLLLTIALAIVDAGLLVWNRRLLRENEVFTRLLRHSGQGA